MSVIVAEPLARQDPSAGRDHPPYGRRAMARVAGIGVVSGGRIWNAHLLTRCDVTP